MPTFGPVAPNDNYHHYLDLNPTGAISGLNRQVHVRYWVDTRVSGGAGSWPGPVRFAVAFDGELVQVNAGFDTRNGADLIPIEYDRWVYVGTGGRDIDASFVFDGWSSSFPQAISPHYTLSLSGVGGVPPAPSPASPAFTDITLTSMRFNFVSNGDGGAAIDHWEVRHAASTGALSSATPISTGFAGSYNATGLPSGSTRYWQARGVNAAGEGSWSAVASASTLPATAPGLNIAPSLNGQSALVTFSPPSGVSGVTKYNLEYREGSSGTPVATSSTTTTKSIAGLTPGQQYQWRANAEIGSYTSPWTGWTPVNQPNPNTNPGDYFDGASAAVADVTYSWVGSANNSQSIGTGKGVDGWGATFTSPAAGFLHQVTGGLVGSYSARVVFTRDCTAAGQWYAGGLATSGYRVDVEELTNYTLSIYANPQGRSQRLAPRVAFYNSAGTLIGSAIVGGGTVAAANVWTRLVITTESPAGAAYAVITATDVAGTGFSVFLAGQYLLLDAAMVHLGSEVLPYFDGNTVDTAFFIYGWTGTANESTSTRTQLMEVFDDPLVDPDCEPFPAPPLPPTIPSDCIDEVGEWRRYTVQVSSVDVPLWGSVLPTLVLNTDLTAERQVRIRYYPNFDGLAPEDIDTSVWEAELILTYIPPNSELTLDGVAQRVWVSVDEGSSIAGDQLLYGTGGVPATWPELTCGVGYVVTLDVPLDAPAGNLSTRVLLTQRV